MSDDVEKIARGLTKAQRALLKWLDPKGFLDWGSRGAPGNRSTRMILCDLGLTECGERNWYRRLSPLGLAVRSYLKDHDNG